MNYDGVSEIAPSNSWLYSSGYLSKYKRHFVYATDGLNCFRSAVESGVGIIKGTVIPKILKRGLLNKKGPF